MKNRRNQVIITAFALMIVVAGYLSYTDRNVKDQDVAKEASTELKGDHYNVSDDGTYELSEEDVFTDEVDLALEDGETNVTGDTSAEAEETTAKQEADAEPQNTETASAETDGAGNENAGEAVLTGTQVSNVDYAADVKLSREQVRAQNKETLLGIINNENIDDAAKQDAIQSMIHITDMSEKENEAELLLEAKGFQNVVVSMTENGEDVVLDMGEVTDAKRAQVEDIVKRKTKVAAENIVITPISVNEAATETTEESGK